MSFLKFADTEAGIVVGFSMTFETPTTGSSRVGPRRNVNIATLDRSRAHHVKIVMDLYDGSAQRRRAGVHRRQRQAAGAGVTPRGRGRGFFAPVDNRPTINKAKAGQTIPMKWRVSAP